MPKLSLVVFALILTSCSSAPSHLPQDKQELDRYISSNIEAAFEGHELVEVNVADEEIAATVGAPEVDEVVPEESDEDPIVTGPVPFLEKKNTARMRFWVKYFVGKDRERFQRFINRGEQYREDIEEILESYGLPKELYFLGLIESGYNLAAHSRASAVGPWQFIKDTGKRYGLRVSSGLDERRDLFKSTHAAARYLRDLHNVFVSWELALAAYNAGEYGVLRRIMKYKTRDYYELSKRKKLPRETINYVPKVLAAMHVIKNARKYGFVIPSSPERVFANTELHPVRNNLSLRKIAKRLNVDVSLLKKLNPAITRSRTPRYYQGDYNIRIPLGLGTLLKGPSYRPSRRDEIRRTAEVHRVRRGETLTGIARRYGTTPGKLARLNNLGSWKSHLRIGQKLRVSGKARVAHTPITYRVKAGDNLSHLSQLFRTSVRDIKRANNLKSGRIYVGQKLILPNTKRGIYTVKRGDYLLGIAKKFRQPIEAILKLNKLRRKTIYPGQKLIVDMD